MTEKKEIASIQAFRALAAFAVVCLHAQPFGPLIARQRVFAFLFYGINHLCRFAVPFFFLAAGYFFRESSKRLPLERALEVRTRRLLGFFAGWFLFYALVPVWIPVKTLLSNANTFDFKGLLLSSPQRTIALFQAAPLRFIFHGPAIHLWFLISLLFSFCVLYVCVKRGKFFLFPVSVILYLAGLAGALAVPTPFGSHPVWIFLGPLKWTLFVALGWHIAALKKFPGAKFALGLIAVGFLMQEAEAYLVWRFLHGALLFDFLVGTVPFSAGCFLLALSRPDFGNGTVLPSLGSLSLGIYLCHYYFFTHVRLVSGFFNPLLWQVIYPMLDFLLAAAFVWALGKFRITKALVT